MTAEIEPELKTPPDTLLGAGVPVADGGLFPFPGNVKVEFAGERNMLFEAVEVTRLDEGEIVEFEIGVEMGVEIVELVG